MDQEPRKKRGRPFGIFGGSALRQALRIAAAAESAEVPEAAERGVGRPRVPRAEQDPDSQNQDSCDIQISCSSSSYLAGEVTPLQQLILNQSESQWARERDPYQKYPAEHILAQGRRCIVSETASLGKYNNEDVRKVAAVISEGNKVLWSLMFKKIVGMLGNGWHGLMLSIGRRYDETPLPLRITEGKDKLDTASSCTDSQAKTGTEVAKLAVRSTAATTGTPSISRTKRTAKILQNELIISTLLRHDSTGQFVHLRSRVPTPLQCLESTKAEQIRDAQGELLARLPDLKYLAQKFDSSHMFTTTDRFSANLCAEKSIQSDYDSKFSLTHMMCQIHELSGCEKNMASIVSGHIGGMLSIGLCMRNAGALKDLRAALGRVLRREVQVLWGLPRSNQHRDAIYNLFLPIAESDLVSTEVRQSKSDSETLGHLSRSLI